MTLDLLLHLGVEDAGRGFDNAGGTAVSLDLEDLAVLVGDDSEEVNKGILGVHVKDEAVGNRVLLASGDRELVGGRRQVAQDTGGWRRVFRKR